MLSRQHHKRRCHPFVDALLLCLMQKLILVDVADTKAPGPDSAAAADTEEGRERKAAPGRRSRQRTRTAEAFGRGFRWTVHSVR